MGEDGADSYDDESTFAVPDRRDEPAAAAAQRVSLVLYNRDGAEAVPLTRGQPIVIGRAPPSDVVVEDRTLSRRHARIAWREDGVWLEDLGSKNGSEVNGRVVERVRIAAGDEILLGSVAASIHVLAPGEAGLEALESHDRFLTRLDQEVVRSRSFGRSLSVLALRARGRRDAHPSSWLPALRGRLRDVDYGTPYGTDGALIALPEAGPQDAVEMAHQLVAAAPRAARLTCAVVCFPRDGRTTDELLELVQRVLRRTSASQRVAVADEQASGTAPGEQFVVGGERMRAVMTLVRRVAPSTIPVLIQGETGTGKELVARAIHTASPRHDGPMESINCGAIAATLLESTLFGHVRGAFTGAEQDRPGLFEQADGGTLFLDEVGELSPSAQAALLRVLESGSVRPVGGQAEVEVDVRVVAATHRDLESMCDDGAFRRDLLFRLNAVVVEVPPLRERTDEIEPLATHFLELSRGSHGREVHDITPDARELLRGYRWPGNVRELRNVIERAVVVSDGPEITPEDLPLRVRRPTDRTAPDAAFDGELSFRERVQAFEREMMAEALRRADGNKSEAARMLRMPRRTFMSKVREYDLD